MGSRHGVVLEGIGDSTARRGSRCPKGWKKRRERLGEEKDLCIATHCSLEGLGYLGMLSASPTDMGADCFR